MKKPPGKEPKWTNIPVLGTVQTIVNLPQASISGAKQRRLKWHNQLKAQFDVCRSRVRRDYPIWSESSKLKIWKERSGRSVAVTGQAGISACYELHSHMDILVSLYLTGIPSENYLMRCPTGTYNRTISRSCCHDVTRNPNYPIGPDFPYRHTY